MFVLLSCLKKHLKIYYRCGSMKNKFFYFMMNSVHRNHVILRIHSEFMVNYYFFVAKIISSNAQDLSGIAYSED